MNKKVSLLILMTGLVFQGCAHTSLERNLDQKLAEEPKPLNRSELRNVAENDIRKIPGLTTDQRAKLLELKDTTGSQLDLLVAQSLKLRAVLVKDVLAKEYNDEEIGLIRGRLRNLEEQRLSVMFSAIEKANAILGRNTIDNPALMRQYYDIMGIRGTPN